MMNEKTTYIILHESWLASWLKDFGSLGSLAGLIYVNHAYGVGNWFVDAVGALMLFAFLMVRAHIAKGHAYRFTKDDLRQWALDEFSRGDIDTALANEVRR